MKHRSSQFFYKNVFEANPCPAVVVLQTDISFSGEISDFTPRFHIPVDYLLVVEFYLDVITSTGNFEMIPFTGGV